MNRTTLIIIFAVGVVAIAGFIGILTGVFRGPDSANDNVNLATNQRNINAVENPTNTSTTVQPGLDGSSVSLEPISAAEQETRDQLKAQALLFAATYGTFSNQNSNEHLSILLEQTTTPLRTDFEKAIANATVAPVGEYLGFTTTAVSAEVRALTTVTATVVVATTRIERADGKDDRSFNQSLLLIFKKVNDTWRVGELSWQPETQS